MVKHSGDSVYDALLLPALTYAERDQGEGRLSAEEKQGIVDATRELISDAETARRARQPDVAPSPDPPATERVMVLGLPAHTDADRVALEILAKLLEGTPFVLQIASVHALSSDAVAVGRRYLHGASGAAPDHQVGPLARVVEGPLGREDGQTAHRLLVHAHAGEATISAARPRALGFFGLRRVLGGLRLHVAHKLVDRFLALGGRLWDFKRDDGRLLAISATTRDHRA